MLRAVFQMEIKDNQKHPEIIDSVCVGVLFQGHHLCSCNLDIKMRISHNIDELFWFLLTQNYLQQQRWRIFGNM